MGNVGNTLRKVSHFKLPWLVGDRLVAHRALSIHSYDVRGLVFCMSSGTTLSLDAYVLLQKQGKKLRREGKDKWIDFAGKVRPQNVL